MGQCKLSDIRLYCARKKMSPSLSIEVQIDNRILSVSLDSKIYLTHISLASSCGTYANSAIPDQTPQNVATY